MKRLSVLLIAAASPILGGLASAVEVTKFDRFRLWNVCLPMDLLIESLPRAHPTSA